tara:strand:- start:978 stop:2666 length:1689 start_codon:yes stop_codon:yes gene_type:complete
MELPPIKLDFKASNDLVNYNILNITNIQCFNPLYEKFFILNDNNYNNIILNQSHIVKSVIKQYSYNNYLCLLKKEEDPNKITKDVFVKFAPLIDPVKYMIGKYGFDKELFILPDFKKKTQQKKLSDTNNSSYTEGFFTFLISKLLNDYKFLNAPDFYGSYLANHNKLKINIYEDIDFLNESDDFHKFKKEHFQIDDSFYDELSNYDSNYNKKRLMIKDDSDDVSLNILDLSFNNETILGASNEIIELNSLNDINIEEVIVSNDNNSRCSSLTNSTCSSRSSYTNSDNDENDSDEESDQDETSEEEDEEEIFAYIENFPINVILIEKCIDTLDSYMTKNNIEEQEWENILLQIIFTLITYQKVFDFTHNDLHTNNIMYVETDKKYIYYGFNNKIYKVHTYGKIWKIIDFGRSIYKFNGKTMFSDSFSLDGDAATQFNCEPYLNKDKQIVNPNKSFDLCRLGCSLFDYFINNIKMIKDRKNCDNLQELIIEWCSDDKNKNVLYKNNGEERYPEFKLYKMITRSVNNHTPEKQLDRVMFDKYRVSKKKLNKKTKIINIDKFPVCT